MAQRDPYFDDFRGLDLDALDLDHIELEDAGPSAAWRWLGILSLVGLGGLIVWLPSSDFYLSHQHENWLFFTMSGGAAVVGILGGRWLWLWGQQAAARYAAQQRPRRPPRPWKPPTAFARAMTLLTAIGGGIVILVVMPQSGTLQAGGSGMGDSWFLAAGGAVVVGILAGRWLLMQQHVQRPETRPSQPITLPPWFKWVTLAVIVAGGLFVLFGSSLFGIDAEGFGFGFGGIAFVIGIFAAIWLAKRFDETEARLRREALERRGRPANPDFR